MHCSRFNAASTVVLEMPGVDRESVDVEVADGVLTIEGRINFGKYEGLQPVYTEYNIGNFARSFHLPRDVQHDRIKAELKDGVMTVTLPKAEKAKPRTIKVG